MDKNTFGDGKAAETLAKIIDTKYPKCSRKVSCHYHRFGTGMRMLFYSLFKYEDQHGFLLSILRMYREKEFGAVNDMNLPAEVKSYLLNVMSKTYKFYVNTVINAQRRRQSEQDKARHKARQSKNL
jgi:hypothetical protein